MVAQTENNLNRDILKTIMMIHEKFPELSKYLEEMTVTIPDINIPEISTKILREYNSSLDALLIRFTTATENYATR